VPSTRRRFLATLGAGSLAATAGCVTLDEPARNGTWPTAGFTDARTHRTDAFGPTGYLYPSWSAETNEGAPNATPVVHDTYDAVYVLQSNHSADVPRTASVAAYDAATGEARWQRFLLTESTNLLDVHFDSLCLHDGLLYAQTVVGVHALDPTKGTREWFAPLRTRDQPWPRSGAPVVEGATLVAGPYGDRESGGELRGYDPETGEERWRTPLSGYADLWTLAAADGTVYAPFLGDGVGRRGVVAVDAESGDVRWESSIPVQGPLTVTGDRLVVPLRVDDREFVAVLDRSTRDIQWREPAIRRTDGGVAVANDRAFHVSDGRLVARRLDTGDREWSFGDGCRLVRLGWTPTVAGDHVYAAVEELTMEGTPTWLYALGVDDGAIYGSGPLGPGTGWSSLGIVEGAAYLTTSRGEVRCYESCTRAAFGRCVLG
jgi:outer membrane protein assembly factor BamB